MASAAFVESFLEGMDRSLRKAFRAVFDYVLSNLRFGRPVVNTRAENFQLYFVTTTTPSVANTAFSIAHNLNVTPYLVLQVLNPQAVGARMVRLKVEQLADSKRIYLSSPDTSAPIALLVEG